MIQKGFSWQENGDHHVWVYRNGAAPEQTVTRKFGRLNSFYGNAGSAADTNITDFENSIQGFIHETRAKPDGYELDTRLSASLVSHLEMRSLFLRDEISRLGDRVAKFILDKMSSKKHYTMMMSSYLKNHPELLDQQMEKHGIAEELRPAVREAFMLAFPQKLKESASDMAVLAQQLYKTMSASLAETAKSSHNKALEGDFSEIDRTRSHLQMIFRVLRATDAELILPDTSLAFFRESGCAPVSDKGDRVEAVVVPLATSVAIVGRRNPHFFRDSSTIRRALASCAHEAFLSNVISPELQALSRRIGKNARLISEADLSKIVRFERLLKV